MAIFKSTKPESLVSGANLITILRLLFSLFFSAWPLFIAVNWTTISAFGLHWLVTGWMASGLKLLSREHSGSRDGYYCRSGGKPLFSLSTSFFPPGLALPVALYMINFAFVDFI
jgi:hypothetical protein